MSEAAEKWATEQCYSKKYDSYGSITKAYDAGAQHGAAAKEAELRTELHDAQHEAAEYDKRLTLANQRVTELEESLRWALEYTSIRTFPTGGDDYSRSYFKASALLSRAHAPARETDP